jgi:hypothetical protein
VARHREIEDGTKVTFYIQKKYADKLMQIAWQRGMTLSEYLRMLVSQHLVQLNNTIQDPVRNPPVSQGSQLRDPVLDRELKDFSNMIDELEGEVSMCEYRLDQLQQSVMDLRRGFKVYLNYYELNNIGDWIKRLNDKWYKYKRWYYSLKNKAGLEDVAQLGERFVKVKDDIDKMYKTYKEISKIIDTNRDKILYKTV